MTHQQAVDRKASERYLLDEMPELERFQFEEHYFDCAECAEDVRLGALMREGVQTGLLPGEQSVARPLTAATPAAGVSSPGASWRTALPWAVAAMLALSVGYQSLWVVPGLREDVLTTQALSPVTVRAATRGAVAEVSRPASGPLALAIDVAGVPAESGLAYDLRTADGVSVATGTAEAPLPGAPLLVLVPGSALRAAGDYTLSVSAAAGGDAAPVHYRFVIRD